GLSRLKADARPGPSAYEEPSIIRPNGKCQASPAPANLRNVLPYKEMGYLTLGAGFRPREEHRSRRHRPAPHIDGPESLQVTCRPSAPEAFPHLGHLARHEGGEQHGGHREGSDEG